MDMALDGKVDTETAFRIRELGMIQLTPDAKEVLDANPEVELVDIFMQYANGNYGAVTDPGANDVALYTHTGACEAVYVLPNGQKIVVKTLFNQTITKVEVEGE